MKLLFFDDWKLGVLKGDSVVDVSAVVTGIPHTGPHNLISGLIERFAEHKARLEEAVPGVRGCRSARSESGRRCRSPAISWRWR